MRQPLRCSEPEARKVDPGCQGQGSGQRSSYLDCGVPRTSNNLSSIGIIFVQKRIEVSSKCRDEGRPASTCVRNALGNLLNISARQGIPGCLLKPSLRFRPASAMNGRLHQNMTCAACTNGSRVFDFRGRVL